MKKTLIVSLSSLTALTGAWIGAEALLRRRYGARLAAQQIEDILVRLGYKGVGVCKTAGGYEIQPCTDAAPEAFIRTWVSGGRVYWTTPDAEIAASIRYAVSEGDELIATWHDGEAYTHTDTAIQHTVWPGGPLPTERISA